MAGCIGRVCGALVLVALTGSAVAAAAERQVAHITVCLEPSARVASGLTRIQQGILLREAAAIWSRHGVRLQWAGDNACDRHMTVKTQDEAHVDDRAAVLALGWVPFAAGRARQLVFLNLPRALSLVQTLSAARGPAGAAAYLQAKLLGRVLAHEVGHVLLEQPAHSPSGLMRPHYQPTETLRHGPASYTLSSEERVRLFERLHPAGRRAGR